MSEAVEREQPVGYHCEHQTITFPAAPGSTATNTRCKCTMEPVYARVLNRSTTTWE